MKKSFCLILLALCLVLSLALPVSAADGGPIYDTGLEWSFEDGVLTISGEGRLQSYYEDAWSAYSSQIHTIVVEEGVTEICGSSFSGMSYVTTVTIADSVTVIGEKAFSGCKSLRYVTLPANLTSLGVSAFSDCTSLDKITLPDSLTVLEDKTFYGCTALKTVEFPENLTSLGEAVFKFSTIRELVLPEGVTSIGKSCFEYCAKLEKIQLPSTLTSIGDNAFADTTALTSAELPGSLSVIPEKLFAASGLQKIVIPEGVTLIDRYAFRGCKSLTDVTLPSTLTEIDDYAFSGCALTQIDLPEGLTRLGAETFYKCDLTEITLPEGLKSIPDRVFGANELTYVKIPSTVSYIGLNAFSSNPLAEVEFAPSVEILNIEDHAFAGLPLVELHLPEGTSEIDQGAFAGCASLTTVTMPDTVTRLGYDVFKDCTSLTSIRLSAGVDWLMPGVLQNTNIQELVIPYGVELIHNGALDDNLQMTRLEIPATVNNVGDMFRSMCYNAMIYCQEDTYIQRWCDSKRVEYTLMEDYEFERSHPINILTNMGGTVTLSRESSPALRYITLTAVPQPDWILYAINVYVDSEESFNLQANQLSDTQVEFLMPDAEIWLEVIFATDRSPFDDVQEDAFYFEPVLWAVYSGITNGTGPSTFSPDAPCNRAQVVTFLWRAAGEPEPITTVNPFADVVPGSFYEKAVLWAVENGITNGIDATHFGPNEICNRAAVVTFLWRAHGKPAPINSANPFRDVPDGSWYADAVLWALENGITNGVSAEEFGATAPCNRAQVVTFLYRYFMNIE